MDKRELERIIATVTKECEKNFDRHKEEKYTLAELTVIPFASKEISTRKVNDWGTDEDRDKYIWYSTEGWQKADMTVQVGAGVSQVVEKSVNTITQQCVAETLLDWGLFTQMEFIHKAYSVLALSGLRSELY